MILPGPTTTTFKRRSLLAAILAATCLGGAATPAAATALVDLQVIDRETGQAARVWRHGGRLYVAGRSGARYSLRVTNNTAGRVLAVISVDGVNVLTGATAAYGQRGYVFRPYETYDISGWRKSDRQVAAFTFAPERRSYAARTGRPDDVGVIGVAAFTERTYAPVAVSPVSPQAEEWRGSGAAADASAAESRLQSRGLAPPPPAPAMAAPPMAEQARRPERLGTGHGAREWSEVTTVPFERATSYPQFIRRIEYDSHANLVARGVIPRARPAPSRPRAFPSSDPNGYVPDPPYDH